MRLDQTAALDRYTTFPSSKPIIGFTTCVIAVSSVHPSLKFWVSWVSVRAIAGRVFGEPRRESMIGKGLSFDAGEAPRRTTSSSAMEQLCHPRR